MPMPDFTKSPPELVERFDAVAAEFPAAQRRLTFGYPCLYVGGNMVTGLFKDAWHVRLGGAEQAEALALDGAAPVRADARSPDDRLHRSAAVGHRGRRSDPPLGRARDRVRSHPAAEGPEAKAKPKAKAG